MFTEYEAINQQQRGTKYYWVKEQMRVPIKDIIRVDTLNIIGKGFAISQDPRLYANVEEPYLMVEDCGLGCSAKLYSEDKSIAKTKLKELWDSYLDCKYRGRLDNTAAIRPQTTPEAEIRCRASRDDGHLSGPHNVPRLSGGGGNSAGGCRYVALSKAMVVSCCSSGADVASPSDTGARSPFHRGVPLSGSSDADAAGRV